MKTRIGMFGGVVVALGVVCSSSWAGGADYGLDLVTVGHAGNRLPTEAEAPFGAPFGRVDYEYRIMRTPVTVGMWWEFVQAYAPYTDDRSPEFTSDYIFRDFDGVLHPPSPDFYQRPANLSFRYAARFVNWLHNGKGGDQASFENGAYDTSTFTRNPDGSFNDQSVRNPDARFWIPTIDEWTKANHYDPNRYGPGEGGYWLYPDGGNEPLVAGLPEDGAETDAGMFTTQSYMDVGSYPWSVSPLGLLDASGGLKEWTSSASSGGHRYVLDSGLADGLPEYSDRIDYYSWHSPDVDWHGFRIVTLIPAPSGGLVLAMMGVAAARRRR